MLQFNEHNNVQFELLLYSGEWCAIEGYCSMDLPTKACRIEAEKLYVITTIVKPLTNQKTFFA
ncbi:hypothetical protein HYC85_014478 [Camellia sinensis]|uniref:Uncharacterized protein n=1 Tax=Camellia sinensis TaxID=4442 RepID=A0A7J7H8D6_CAMSI|nr:hypothetical protein HYC85_014478 [Camellia sinensis]